MTGGPLAGMRVLEIAAIGPVPFAGMILADLGADVVRVDRPPAHPQDVAARLDVVNRGKRSVALDLKTESGRAVLLRLVDRSDILIEGMRPGVMERLGAGPQEVMDRNPRLVYGRMTGWGQSGPLAAVPGHDLTYLAITGALWAMGRSDERPAPPLNLVADYGGGAMFLLVGVLAAIVERATSGRGQVVDAAMVDGVVALTSMFTALRAMGLWTDERGANFIDSGAPYYDVYECADGRFISVAALEPKFYAELVRRTGFREGHDEAARVRQPDRERWAADRAEWAALFRSRTRDQWAEQLADTDACVQPVLDWNEAPAHSHLRERQTFTTAGGVTQPAPAPRFSRTPASLRRLPPLPGEHTAEILAEVGAGEAGT